MVTKKHQSFGELELDLGWDEVSETETPVSGVRRAPETGRVIPGVSAREARQVEDATRIGNSPLEAAKLDADPRSAGTISDPRLDQVRALYASGNAEAALAFAEKISEQPPPASARSFAASVAAAVRAAQPARAPEPYADIQDDVSPADQEQGTAIFAAGASNALSQVAALSGTPYVAMTLAEVQRLPLDPRAGFLMSMIDGASTIPDLCDLAGMPEDEVVSVLTELARHKVIAFK
jgi:hypothetical protein